MHSVQHVAAHSITQPSDRPPRQYEPGRTCRRKGCITVLSVYNRGPFCTLHAPFERWGGMTPGRPKKAVA